MLSREILCGILARERRGPKIKYEIPRAESIIRYRTDLLDLLVCPIAVNPITRSVVSDLNTITTGHDYDYDSDVVFIMKNFR